MWGSVYGFTGAAASGRYGFLFSGSASDRDGETTGQIDRGLTQRQAGVASPEVEHIALGLTLRMEAAEETRAQVDRELSMQLVRIVVQRTGAAALRTDASQRSQVTEFVQDGLHRDLPA